MSDYFIPVLDSEQDLLFLLKRWIPDSEALNEMPDEEFSGLQNAVISQLGLSGMQVLLDYLQKL